MERSSAAFSHAGRIWLVDPLRPAPPDGEFAALGRVHGVVMTVPWHDRDVAWFATLHGVPVYVAGWVGQVRLRARVAYVGARVPDSPLELVDAGGRGMLAWWKEVAVWWPAHRALYAGDALGRASYFVRPGEHLAVHPLRRLSPPGQLAELRPARIYCGHGSSLEAGAAEALDEALRTARSALVPSWLHGARVTARRLSARLR